MKPLIWRGTTLLLCLTSATASAQIAGQGWPQRPVRLVLGFPPGGGIDVVARLLSVPLSERLGQQVVVDNRPGANGILGVEITSKAAPDGHTFFVGTTGNITVNAILVKNLPFSMDRDFVPVMQTSSVPFLIYVYPKVPAKSLDELIAHVKANPGKVNYYSSGNGGLPHLASELLNNQASIKAIHVPYKGSAPGFNDLLGGQVQFGFDAASIGLQHVKAGRIRAVATTGPKRLAFLPDVPAANESLKGFEVVNWYGIIAPTGTPTTVIERLNSEILRAFKIPELREKLIAQGTDPVDSNPKAFGTFMKAESAKWGRVVKEANIRTD